MGTIDEMETPVEYWSNKREEVITEDGFRSVCTRSVLTKYESWKGTKEEIFKRFDKENNRLRYCNGSYYRFALNYLNEEYLNWYKSLSESTKLDMFYGNGVVD